VLFSQQVQLLLLSSIGGILGNGSNQKGVFGELAVAVALPGSPSTLDDDTLVVPHTTVEEVRSKCVPGEGGRERKGRRKAKGREKEGLRLLLGTCEGLLLSEVIC